MFLNLLCIGEAAAFELPGIYHLKDPCANVEPDEPDRKKIRLEPVRENRGKRLLKWFSMSLENWVFICAQKWYWYNHLISFKDSFYEKTIDSIFRQVTETNGRTEDQKLHFVHTGDFSFHQYPPHYRRTHFEQLRPYISKGIQDYRIKSVTMTTLPIRKDNLITHEEMKKYYRKKYFRKYQSLNDDLEWLFENLQLDENINRFCNSFFLPKLTENQEELVRRRDKLYFDTFSSSSPEVNKQELKLSKSDSQYVNYDCISKTSMMFYKPLWNCIVWVIKWYFIFFKSDW